MKPIPRARLARVPAGLADPWPKMLYGWLRNKISESRAKWLASPRASLIYAFVTVVLFVLGHESQTKSGFDQAKAFLGFGNRCAASDPALAHDRLPLLYTRLMQWSSRPAHKDVSIVYIPLELASVQQNVCTARNYLAEVLTAIGRERPALIVVDKYFGNTACAPDDPNTQKLVSTIRGLPFPVIAGLASHQGSPALAAAGACLVEEPRLEGLTGPNLSFGLLRPNSDLAKIPLRWKVAVADGTLPSAGPEDTLALRAFSTFAPEMVRKTEIKKALASDRAPYASLLGDLPCQSTTDLLNHRSPSDPKCADNQVPNPILGRVVLVGARSTNDQATVLGRPFWGYELQAYYIDALLTGGYLLAPPLVPSVVTYIVYFLLNALLFPPEGKKARDSWWSWWRSTSARLIFLAVLTIACIAAFLLLHCIPPLGAFLICFPAVVNNALVQVQDGAQKEMVGATKPG